MSDTKSAAISLTAWLQIVRAQKFSMSWHIILYIIYLCDYHNAKPLLHIGAIKQERWSDTLLYNLDELYVCNSWNHKRTIVNGPKKQEAWQDFVQ